MTGSPLTVRPYQQEAVDAVQAAAARGVRRPLVVLPTGSGKTCMFSALIAQRAGSALVLAHRDELLRQAAEKIALADPALGLAVGFVAAERDDVGAPIVVGSVQTLAQPRRLARLPSFFDTVVVDEAHHASARSYRRILSHLQPSPLILGVTATPARSDTKPLGAIWQEIVFQKGILEMIQAGYLADVRGIRVGLQALHLDQVKRSGGDFEDEALADALEQAAAPRHVLAAYEQHAAGRKTLVFVPTVKLAYHMAKMFGEAGIAAEGLDGTATPDRRRAVIDRLRAGETTVLMNAALFVEGFDEPSIDCIVVASPTRSQVRYSQIVGRGLRPFPGKDDCLVLDVVGASDKLDLQTLPRLFGIKGKLEDAETVTEALDRETRETPSQTAVAAGVSHGPGRREGAMRSRQVQLLRAPKRDRRLRWLRHSEHWLLAAGQVVIALTPTGDRWSVLALDRDSVRQLASDVELAYAHGIAEDYVRHVGATALADPNARWRQAPITPAQASRLRRLGVTPPDGTTKGQASDMIAVHEGARRLKQLPAA
ncbi:MAG: DEAD/DEAH box helicase [Solirubrobacteraceae bacterium]